MCYVPPLIMFRLELSKKIIIFSTFSKLTFFDTYFVFCAKNILFIYSI